jgi:uncharacterized RDD family membrane protein YckC
MFVEPEPWDDSEEQFESSLISSEQPDCYRSIALGPLEESSDRQQDVQSQQIDRRERRAQLDRDLSLQAEAWRDTLSSKLDQYRNRRGKNRLSGEYTMSLDFERTAHRTVMYSATAPAIEPSVDLEPAGVLAQEPVRQPSYEEIDVPGPAAAPADRADAGDFSPSQADNGLPEESVSSAQFSEPATPEPPQKKRPERKVIEFPRLFAFESPEPSRDELAEPILDKPRIMDVPEETEQIELPLGGISLGPAYDEAAAPASELDVPIQVAAVSQRFFAGITDNVLILIATALFAGIVLNFTGDLPHNKLVLLIALAVPAVFWLVYHYLFLVHAATTPGMSVARIRVATFDGVATNRNIRRGRALAMLISGLSAGLGFAWAYVDEDTLCWHDKISRTYLTNR